MALVASFSQPWLKLNRLLTFQLLARKVHYRAPSMRYEADPGSLLYVAASSLPYHSSGYTTRTHELVCALQKARRNVHVVTRPGYPWDRRDRLVEAESEETAVGYTHYYHIRHPCNLRPVLQYSIQGARSIAQVAIRKRVSVIHAASNHVNALPSLLAARHLGIPFQYEMRGLWELTRVARMPKYEGSQGYRQGLQLEGLVARSADRLFVISDQLGYFAQEKWGIPAERIALLPNCVDPERIYSADSADFEPDTIGYAGSLISYEGLDTLIDAVAQLIKLGRRVGVNIIGHGEAEQELREQTTRLGLDQHIRFFGKMSPIAAREKLSRCALVCIPRKPHSVCEIVPPIKLVEALALGKPVVVADLPVLRDELGATPAGWFFKPGDFEDLAEVIDRALRSQSTFPELGARAREHAIAHRRWEDFVNDVLPMAQNGELNGRRVG
ncbi:glycosyltransferase [Achromobacter sp. ES-001]|uniref:glycosyltransferase n=1 Tax=Achromobacter sp. ES-001 TaxID=2860286 RepID=UPI00351D5A9C